MIFQEYERVLLIGMGGGGDVVGTLPTYRFLESIKKDVYLGGLTWERLIVDPKPGPRKTEEIINARRISKYAVLANSETRTESGVTFSESLISSKIGKEVILIDVSGGVEGTRESLEDVVCELDFDLVIGIDVGGDVLARGNEPGLRSPLADSLMLAALNSLKGADTLIGVFGYGSDGELSVRELNERFSEICRKGGYVWSIGLDVEVAEEMEELTKEVPTEASMLPLLVVKGELGLHEIRGGRRVVNLTPLSLITFYFRTEVVYQVNGISKLISNTESLEEANEILLRNGIYTELEYERRVSGLTVEGE